MRHATYASIVGQLLAKLRLSQDVAQADIARKLGIQQSVISRMENGSLSISVTKLARWATALDTSGSQVLAMADRAVIALQGRHDVQVTYMSPRSAKRRWGVLKGAEVGALLTLSL